MQKKSKGDFGWKQIAELLLVLGVLIVLIVLMMLFGDKSGSLVDFIRNIVRFG